MLLCWNYLHPISHSPDSISKALDKSYKEAKRISAPSSELKWIIFSDHHRGRRDGADDFLICEQNYLRALDHYHEQHYTLCMLGDVEEFWENSPLVVMSNYVKVLSSEKRFFDTKRLHRIWGNHDDDWRAASIISKYLSGLFPKIQVHESLVLELEHEGVKRDVLLVHGHQGTLESDRFSWLSRLFVRFIWRNIQRLFKVPLSTPANNIKLKSRHDQSMYAWAAHHDRVVISGHTHHPVFMSYTHADKVKSELADLIEEQEASPTVTGEEQIKDMRAKLLTIQLDEGESALEERPKPYYFNSGCCSYSDGDITGIEIADGEIRLIKWDNETHERKVLGSTRLSYLLLDH